MSSNRTEPGVPSQCDLLQEIARLKAQLEAVQKTQPATPNDPADALVVPAKEGEHIFTPHSKKEPYRVFVETMNEGAVMVTADGTIVYSNRHFADMVKAPLERVIGCSIQQFIFQPVWPADHEFQGAKETAGYRRECTLKARDGTLVPIFLSARPMIAGGIRSFCITATDITERKRAEEKVRASEQQLRLIFNQIPAILWTTDTELRLVSGNGRGLAAANRPREELIGMTLQEFLGDPDGKSVPIAAHRAALKGEAGSYEHNFNGTILSVTVQPLRNAEGDISGVIGVALDVTESKRATASVAKLAAIVESTQDAIYGTTMSGYITTWNRGAERMYGYSAGEIAGKHISIIVPEAKQNEPLDVLEKVKRGEIVRPFETVRRRKDGSLIDVSITASAVKDATGHLIGISAISHDLSDRKLVEMELRKLSGRLLKVQDEARRNMARELHDSVIQGLAAAVINLSMMKDSAQLLPEARKTVEETLKITEEAVREIRTFSYLLHPPLLDVTGLQSALRWYVEGYSKRSGVHVTLDLPDGWDRMPEEIELTLFRIVQEALTNIQRHSGGREASISMRRTPEELILTVSDDGRGMDAETLKKVRREGAVLGVGIAGMKQRLQQFGGWLQVSSSSKGTTVEASLPVAKETR